MKKTIGWFSKSNNLSVDKIKENCKKNRWKAGI